jgi:folylpolyglutamate synthase/dihydropteroate synthase
MDETYELNDEDRQVIASQIKDIDEEAFAKYLENMKVLLSSKDKETLKEQSEKAEKATEETKASDEHENVVEEALDKAEKSKEETPVSATASDPEVTVYDKYKKAFDVENWSLGKR